MKHRERLILERVFFCLGLLSSFVLSFQWLRKPQQSTSEQVCLVLPQLDNSKQFELTAKKEKEANANELPFNLVDSIEQQQLSSTLSEREQEVVLDSRSISKDMEITTVRLDQPKKENENENGQCIRVSSNGEESIVRNAGNETYEIALFWNSPKQESVSTLQEKDGSPVITLTTQGSLNRLERMEMQILRWKGPASIAVLICTQEDLDRVVHWLQQLKEPQAFGAQTSVHLVSGKSRAYPVNLMRNVAREGVREGEFELIVDADAWLGGSMKDMSAALEEALELTHHNPKTAFILASFELTKRVKDRLDLREYPQSADALKEQFKTGRVRAMHEGRRSYSGPFKHVEWIRSSKPYALSYEVMFEPYVILRREGAPNFPETFVGRGFNKQAFHFELFCAGYAYVALSGPCFTVDLPHEHEEAWTASAVVLEDNKPLFRAFREATANRYGIECAQEDWERCDKRSVGCHRVCQLSSHSSKKKVVKEKGTSKAAEMRQSREEAKKRLAESRSDLHWRIYMETLQDRSNAGLRKRQGLVSCLGGGEDGSEPLVDVVFTWVNGSDPEHRKIQSQLIPEAAFQEKLEIQRGGVPVGDLAFRFRDFEEASTLRFSLRSIYKFAPWVRRIWIVTAGQTPSWMNASLAKTAPIPIQFVDHKDIFSSPEQQLPTVNSCAIESQLHRIPGLAECYLYLNDDFLMTREFKLEDFADVGEGEELVHLPRVFFTGERVPRSGRDKWQQKIVNVAEMMHNKMDLRWEHMYSVGHHGYFFSKPLIRQVSKILEDELERTSRERWRTPFSVWLPLVYSNYVAWNFDVSVAKNRAFYFALTSSGGAEAVDQAFQRLESGQYDWLCINDLAVVFSSDIQHALARNLARLFPQSLPFEIDS